MDNTLNEAVNVILDNVNEDPFILFREGVRKLQCINGVIKPYAVSEDDGIKWPILNTDKIDILIPCYGQSKTVKETVLSCLCQQRQPTSIKILLMDSASQFLKDELEELSPLIHCIKHMRMNTSAARNYLASISDAEWIIFLDADDTLYPNFIKEVTSRACAVCYPTVHYVGESQRKFHTVPGGSHEHPYSAIIQNMTCLLRREIMDEFQFDEDLWEGGEDTDFMIRLIQSKKYYMWRNIKTAYWYKYTEPNLRKNNFYKHQKKLYFKHRQWLLSQLDQLFFIHKQEYSMIMWLLKNWSEENWEIFTHSVCFINLDKKEDNRYVTFTLNRKCNQKCSYCFQCEDKRELSDEEIYANFDKALTWAEEKTAGHLLPQIMGGEPSIWSEWLQRKIIERVKKYNHVTVFTNGTKIKESLFAKQFNFYFIWHDRDWMYKSLADDYQELDSNYLLNIVVCKGELDAVSRFLDSSGNRPDLHIAVNPCDSQHGLCTNQALNSDEIMDLCTILNQRYIFSPLSTYAFLVRNGGENKFRQICSSDENLGTWNIDCIDMTVSPCCGEAQRYSLEEFNDNVIRHCKDCYSIGNLVYYHHKSNVRGI